MQRTIILQTGPDMPGIQAKNQINSRFDLSDRPRGFLLDAFNVTVVLLFDIVQVTTVDFTCDGSVHFGFCYLVDKHVLVEI